MQIRAVVGIVAALHLLLLGGCASGGGAFHGWGDRAEAERLLQQREAKKERALREAEARAESALHESNEAAERRKREESADLEQERRHRRELKEAKHKAKLRKIYKRDTAQNHKGTRRGEGGMNLFEKNLFSG